MQIFCDLDGVLADFDTGYENAFGVRPSILADNVDWKLIEQTPHFYRDLPVMPGAYMLWNHIKRYIPIILTGIPSSIATAAEDKRVWVTANIGPQIEVRCCASKDKYLNAAPGDILIDDWEKYRDLWVSHGGIWVTHETAPGTIMKLLNMGIG